MRAADFRAIERSVALVDHTYEGCPDRGLPEGCAVCDRWLLVRDLRAMRVCSRATRVLARIREELALADSILGGRHPLFRFLGALTWAERNPGQKLEAYWPWRERYVAEARKRRDICEKRIARVRRIAKSARRSIKT